jgi:hypothetical protein
MKNALNTYTPSVTILPGKDKTEYMSLMRKQLTPEMAELLIDITTVYQDNIINDLKDSNRLELFLTLCANLDGDLV